MIYALTSFQAFDNSRFFILSVGRDQQGNGPADDFLGGVAEQPLRALIPTGDRPGQVLADDRVVRGIDNRTQQTGLAPGVLLSELSVCNIHQQIDPTSDVPLWIAQHGGIRTEPEVASVRTFREIFRSF